MRRLVHHARLPVQWTSCLQGALHDRAADWLINALAADHHLPRSVDSYPQFRHRIDRRGGARIDQYDSAAGADPANAARHDPHARNLHSGGQCAVLLAGRVAAEGLRGVGFLVGVLRLDSVQHRFMAAVRTYFRQPQSRLID